jgi:lipopolysaccharide biosynthesis regulator YciM
MKYMTIQEAKTAMLKNGKNWRIPFMDFVDDFRRTRDHRLIEKPLYLTDDRFDSLLASTVEYLCDEMGIETPSWIWDVPSCKEPWFVSGYENLKAITIVESPAFFRRRKIFVLENFLSRV